MDAYDKNTMHARGEICQLLNGWEVVVHARDKYDDVCPKPGWPLGGAFLIHHACIIGYTHDDSRQLEIETYDYLHSSLAHEVAHVLAPKLGHCAWDILGYKAAIEQVTGEPDLSPEDCPPAPKPPEPLQAPSTGQ